jgi:hypothetical protein
VVWQPWKVDRALADPDEVHVRPRADLRWHQPDGGCWCGPKQQDLSCSVGHRLMLVTHRAVDGRPALERITHIAAGPTAAWEGVD